MDGEFVGHWQREVDNSLTHLAKPYWEPLSQFARLVEEVGELGRLLNHLYGDKPKKVDEAPQEMEEEMGDIIFALICQANREGLNLDRGLAKALEKIRGRDAERFERK